MKQLRAWIARVAGLFNRERKDREFACELEHHIQLHVADNLRAGLTPEEARRQAVLALGGIDQINGAYGMIAFHVAAL